MNFTGTSDKVLFLNLLLLDIVKLLEMESYFMMHVFLSVYYCIPSTYLNKTISVLDN